MSSEMEAYFRPYQNTMIFVVLIIVLWILMIQLGIIIPTMKQGFTPQGPANLLFTERSARGEGMGNEPPVFWNAGSLAASSADQQAAARIAYGGEDYRAEGFTPAYAGSKFSTEGMKLNPY